MSNMYRSLVALSGEREREREEERKRERLREGEREIEKVARNNCFFAFLL
jgi:hypothetical protein